MICWKPKQEAWAGLSSSFNNVSQFQDEKFRDSLLKTISNDRLPRNIKRALNIENSQRALKNQQARSLIYWLNRRSLTWICDLQRINLLRNVKDGESKQTFRLRLDRFINEQTNDRRRKWPSILLACYILCSLLMMLYVYHQYKYDFNNLRLDRLSSNQTENRGLTEQNVGIYRKQLEKNICDARETLRWMGGPYFNWSLIIQIFLAFFVLLSCINYMLVPWYFHSNNLTLLPARTLLDKDNDARVQAQLVSDELQRFVLQSWSFTKGKISQMGTILMQTTEMATDHTLYKRSSTISEAGLLPHRALARTAVSSLMQRHKTTVEQLKEIALEGRLNSLNGSPACRDELSLVFLASLCLITFNTFTGLIGSHYSFKQIYDSKGKPIVFESFMDASFATCVLYILFISYFASLFTFAMHVLTIYAQLASFNRLRELVKFVIRRNEIRFQKLSLKSAAYPTRLSVDFMRKTNIRHWLDQNKQNRFKTTSLRSHQESANLVRSMELDLLMVWLQHRLTHRSYQLARKPISLLTHTIICWGVAPMIMLRLHNSYFYPEFRETAISISLFIMNVCLLFLFPLGLLHQHCLKAFKTLWGLSAQMSHFECFDCVNRYLMVETNVAIFTLRRELSDSEQRMDGLACRVLQMEITYNNLIKASFWLYLGVISLLDNSDKLSGAKSDPFGLYDLEA